MIDGLRRDLQRPTDPASLAAFRIGFGLLATFAALRFVALGWVETLLVDPSFHFAWVSWAVMPPTWGLYALFGAQALAGLGIAWGRHVRVWLGLWLGSFVYVELLDKTLYLNHYVLFTMLGVTLLVTPAAHARFGGPTLPRWVITAFRIEIATVYVWAGLAKLNPDWLFRAEPLLTWLQARAGWPMVGPWIAWDPTAWLMSWSGAAYDLTIPFLLWAPHTRNVGLALLLGFHIAVGVLFPIGIFPWLMVIAATVLLSPSWPRSWLDLPQATTVVADPISRRGATIWLACMATIALFPGRAWFLSNDVAWTEEGYRFGWRVLLNEKTGLVDYRVVERNTGRVWRAYPSAELTPLQHQHMRTQPDMIRDYALHLAKRHAAEGRDVAVFADAWASLNGHPRQRLIRPDVDLTQSLATLRSNAWIVPRVGRATTPAARQ
ncbi:MAG: HTTM domain-containing protein [Myxococcota bacterium]